MDLKVTLFQIRNKVLYVNGEKWWILTDQWERGQYKTLTGRVLYCSSRVSVWQCFGENRRIHIWPCWMETIFFKLPQFWFPTAKGHSKCRRERRNLAEPCPVQGTGGTEPPPACPLHPYGLSEMGRCSHLTGWRICAEESHSPGLVLNIYFLASHLHRHPIPKKERRVPAGLCPRRGWEPRLHRLGPARRGWGHKPPQWKTCSRFSAFPSNDPWTRRKLLEEDGCQLKIKVARKLKI